MIVDASQAEGADAWGRKEEEEEKEENVREVEEEDVVEEAEEDEREGKGRALDAREGGPGANM